MNNYWTNFWIKAHLICVGVGIILSMLYAMIGNPWLTIGCFVLVVVNWNMVGMWEERLREESENKGESK